MKWNLRNYREKNPAMEYFSGEMQLSSVVFPLDQELKTNLSPRITYEPSCCWTGKNVFSLFSTNGDKAVKPKQFDGSHQDRCCIYVR